jgi:hypothetical protein
MYTEFSPKRWWLPLAKFDIKMPGEILERMSRLGKTLILLPKRLEAGGDVVLQKVQSNLSLWWGPAQNTNPAPQVNWNRLWV